MVVTERGGDAGCFDSGEQREKSLVRLTGGGPMESPGRQYSCNVDYHPFNMYIHSTKKTRPEHGAV